MIHEKLKPVDDFWDEKAQERLAVGRLDAEINNLRGAVGLAEKILMLKGSGGWTDFVKAVEDCRAYRRQELELSAGTDSDLRILQGRCRELGAIVSLMTQTETNTEVLASRLKGLVEERALFVKEDGKVQPRGIS
jgi:hypothetical protein